MAPVVYGLSSGTAALPSKAFTIGAPKASATCSSSSVACRAPRPARMTTLRPAFSTPAARASSASSGNRALRANAWEVWWGTLRFEWRRPAVISWTSTGIVRCATPWYVSAVRQARSATFSACVGPITRALYLATSMKSLSSSTSC